LIKFEFISFGILNVEKCDVGEWKIQAAKQKSITFKKEKQNLNPLELNHAHLC